MSQRSNFRRGFFVALVGLSLGLALASGLLALMERFGARGGLQRLATYSAGPDTKGLDDLDAGRQVAGAQTSNSARFLGANEVETFVAAVAFDDVSAIPIGAMPADNNDGLEPRVSFGEQTAPDDLLIGARPPLYIPRLADGGAITSNTTANQVALGDSRQMGDQEGAKADLARGLDGQELALAGDSDLASLSLQQSGTSNASIGALVQQLEQQNPGQGVPNSEDEKAERQVADASLTAFRSTATLKALPSGRAMSWVTPGLAMSEQYNPLYLDQRGYCALTFDDGPDRIKDNRIMDILRSEGVPATFFLLGNKLKGAEATIARMLAEGHEIGNHSWSHPQLTKLSYDKAASQVERTSRALEQLGARVSVFRPPYGAQNKRVREIGKDLGMRMLLWDVDSLDWKLRRGVSIRNEIDKTAYRGSVILMHSHVAGTVEALPEIIADLRAKGCTFVTASQWFDGLNGYGRPLPERKERVLNKPSRPSTPVPSTPAAPTTSYQWNPSPTPAYPSTPTQTADEPIYIY